MTAMKPFTVTLTLGSVLPFTSTLFWSFEKDWPSEGESTLSDGAFVLSVTV